MLVLSRKPDEKIYLIDIDTGTVTSVTVSRVTGNTVRLGFDAPPNVQILREELYIQKQQEAEAAAAAAQGDTEPSEETQEADPTLTE